MVNMHAKFEVSSPNRSRDIKGVENLKSRSRDPFPIPFDLILHFFSLVPQVVNLHAKFEVSSSNRSRDMKGVPKFQK